MFRGYSIAANREADRVGSHHEKKTKRKKAQTDTSTTRKGNGTPTNEGTLRIANVTGIRVLRAKKKTRREKHGREERGK